MSTVLTEYEATWSHGPFTLPPTVSSHLFRGYHVEEKSIYNYSIPSATFKIMTAISSQGLSVASAFISSSNTN